MSQTIETSASLRAPLRHRPYLILLSGSTISQSGDWLYNVALAVYVFDRTGSAGWVAAATVLRLVPYVVLAPIGGVIADRFDRRSVMIWSDVLRALSMGALAPSPRLTARSSPSRSSRSPPPRSAPPTCRR